MSNLTDALEAVHDSLLNLQSRTDLVAQKAENDRGELTAAIEELGSRVAALEEHLGDSLKAVADRLRNTTSNLASPPFEHTPDPESEAFIESDDHAEPATAYRLLGEPTARHSVIMDRVVPSETEDTV